MAGQLIWQFISYALVLSIGGALIAVGSWVPGLIILVGFPAWRISRRFKKNKGYKMASVGGDLRAGGDHGLSEHQLSGLLINRHDHPRLFKILLLLEFLIVGGITFLYLLPS